jgi:hypothetical protein
MLDANQKPNNRACVVGIINPQSSSVALSTGWIDASQFENFLSTVIAGALGSSATVDAKLQQATDNGGTGIKDVAGKAITQLTKAGSNDNSQVVLNLRPDELDFVNGFQFFRLTITPGTAASLLCGMVQGLDAHYDPPTALATVLQVV